MNPVELLAIVVVCVSLLLLCASALQRRRQANSAEPSDADEASAAERALFAASRARQRAKCGLPQDIRNTFHTIVYHRGQAPDTQEAPPPQLKEALPKEASNEGAGERVPGGAGLGQGCSGPAGPTAAHVAVGVQAHFPELGNRTVQHGTTSATGRDPWEAEHPLFPGPAGTSCVVCLADFEEGETLLQLPCSHAFHPDCVTSWFDSHVTCPVCRLPLLPHSGLLKDPNSTRHPTASDPSPAQVAPADVAVSIPQTPEAEEEEELGQNRSEDAEGVEGVEESEAASRRRVRHAHERQVS